MPKIKILLFFFLLGYLLLISSCKKDDLIKTRTQLLTQHTWKFTSAISSDTAVPMLLANQKGSELTFRIDMTYFTNPITGASSTFGTWEFSTDEKELFTNKGTPLERVSEISKLDESSLELKETKSSVVTTFIYEKK